MTQSTRCWLWLLLWLPAWASYSAAADQRQQAIVVGAGIAGLAAALDLARAGVAVTVIDMNSQGSGHAILATGMALVNTPVQQAAGVNDSPGEAVRDWLAYTIDGNEPWLRFYAEQSRERVFDWLAALGVRFEHLQADDSSGDIPRFHYPAAHGAGIVLPLYRAVLKHPLVQFRLHTEITGLMVEHGRVTGVTGTELRSGSKQSWRANHVLLATGGIAGSLEKIRAHWPTHFPAAAEILAGGSVFARGMGHELAVQAGAELAQMDRHWFYPVGIPDPLAPDSGHGITLTSPRGIWVDARGQRFVNPLASNRLILDRIMQQTPTGFWIIFDDATRKLQRARTIRYRHDQARYQREVLLNPRIVQRAEDLATLARRSGLPADELKATVTRYNELVAAGTDTDFGRFPASHSDNVTMPAVAPAPVRTPPFYAVRIYPSNAESMGGVRIDFDARVLAGDGNPIPGLYAAGEITGVMGMNGSRYRVNGLYLGPSILTGRLAAATIAEALTPPSYAPAPAHPAQVDGNTASAQAPAAMRNGEDLRALVQQRRPGYWHFEVAHDVVLSRGLACTNCHDTSFPAQPAVTNTQRLAQTHSCLRCH